METTTEPIDGLLGRVDRLIDEVQQLAADVKASRPRAYSPEEVAPIVDLAPNTIRKMVTDGRVKRIPNTGRRICIADTEIQRVWGIDMGVPA